ncbi:MAG: O-antigen ligase family protein [Gemmatimonadetes bacterium]|nr:O-antigen ligase family protein [Gemmatimonadota bacterium]
MSSVRVEPSSPAAATFVAPSVGLRPRVAQRRASFTNVLIGGFSLLTLLLLSGVGGRPAAIVYALAAGFVALVLHTRDPVAYMSFTLWMWFVSPFVRRVLDMHHGWNPTSPALLAPQFAAAVAVMTLARRARSLRNPLFAPYLLVLAALAYGYSVGIINAGIVPATYALVTWLAPAFFGLFLAVEWRRYPAMREELLHTFRIALPLLAAYGVYQFVRLPQWDSGWMRNADLRSIGLPLPFLVRVFGTLNTPGPFAAVLLTGVLMILPTKGWFRYVSVTLSLLALLLTRTRSAWVAFIVGLFVSQLSQPLSQMPKRTITLIAVALMALPLATMPQFRSSIASRLNTFSNLRGDNSFMKRVAFSSVTASNIVESAEGAGLGSTGGATKLSNTKGMRSLDNGFLEIFYVLGWPGGTAFFLGIAGLLVQSARFAETRADSFAGTARATAVALLSMIPVGDVFTGATGLLLWAMVGFGISAHAYHTTTGLAIKSQARRFAERQRARVPVTRVPSVI